MSQEKLTLRLGDLEVQVPQAGLTVRPTSGSTCANGVPSERVELSQPRKRKRISTEADWREILERRRKLKRERMRRYRARKVGAK